MILIWIISVIHQYFSADADSVCLEPDSLSHSGGDDLEQGVQFSIWVSFYEIYNEFLYDLLDASPSLQPRKRVTLRLSDDKQGNTYVKGNADSLTRIKLMLHLYLHLYSKSVWISHSPIPLHNT